MSNLTVLKLIYKHLWVSRKLQSKRHLCIPISSLHHLSIETFYFNWKISIFKGFHPLFPLTLVKSFFTRFQNYGRWTRPRLASPVLPPFFVLTFTEKWTACVPLVVRTISMTAVSSPCAASFRNPPWCCSSTACQIMRGTGASCPCCLSE